MNQKFCKICSGALAVATLGQFVACGYLVCRECAQPDLASKPGDFSPFQSIFPISVSMATTSAGFTPQSLDES